MAETLLCLATREPSVREYGFELALCGALEDSERLLARQLGAHVHGRRIADIVAIDPGPEFDQRATITDETIPPAAIDAPVGPGQARPLRDVFPDRRPDERHRIADRAVETGFFESERRNGDRYVRQVARYPERWFDRLLGIENKPDLDRPGDLQTQLRTDVSLGLFDEVILATASHVTGAHRNRLPEEVGIWLFDPDTGEREVLREPTSLPTDEWGLEVIEREAGQATVQPVDPAAKARARRRVAERAYGKGWRTFAWPACARCDPDGAEPVAAVPYCSHYDRIVNPVKDCGESCRGYEPADPPAVDVEAVRDSQSPWVRDPAGRQRRQVGLDRFE